MCGLVGYWQLDNQRSAAAMDEIVNGMSQTIFTRGPDDAGSWTDPSVGLALAHRRLSILDLSAEGKQPMTSPSGRYVISYNGEVYNFQDMRQELSTAGFSFRGGSDTEVLLAGFEHWGITETVQRCVGMFACAIWDSHERRLLLARDRMGIKPLYFGRQKDLWIFCSQPKAIHQHPAWQARIDRAALCGYVEYNYVPSPGSIYEDLEQVEPGTIISIDPSGVTRKTYWNLTDIHNQRAVFGGDSQEAKSHLDQLLKDAVGKRMIADVPLGAFLSGGVDSSTVVALMQQQSSSPVKTFSIGFYEDQYNEAKYAQAVAEHLGTDHTELYVSPEDALNVIPQLPEHYDEPFSDVSQIPQLLVCELTRKHVTVALSGDGGDELFAGYNRYLTAKTLQKIFILPHLLRRLAAGSLELLSTEAWDQVFKLIPKSPSLPGDKLHKLARTLKSEEFTDVYAQLVSGWFGEQVVLGKAKTAKQHKIDVSQQGQSVILSMQLLDSLTYLPNDILAKVDRASMAVSLEARVPLLDHRVVEFAWSLPETMKIRDSQSKWLLRQILYEYVPKKLIERPKMGFGVPIDQWLRGPLKDWAHDLLAPDQLRREGFLDAGVIERKLKEHMNRKRNWQYQLWNVLMFQAWKRRWMA